ncbi:hypothetical protein ABZT17_08425 [Streptomyces sp. NPDC005648]|uniref:hypothetical protein n=1 Tax=Streptomyces sp. NPDC005648 TaxID=3157044 RepID=UPI0033A2FA94
MDMDERTTSPDDEMEPEESKEALRAALLNAWTAGLPEADSQQCFRSVWFKGSEELRI